MAATTTLLGLVTPTQGTLTGTWGDTVNYGISDYVDISVAGTLTLTNDGAVTLANTTGSSAGSNITSSLTGAGTVTAQFAIVRVTGTLTVAKVVTGPSYSKTYTVVNAATGGIVTFKASGQTGVSVAVGESAFVYFNGTDYVKIVGTATAGAAGGSTTQVQYNNAGVLAGITGATTNGTALTLVAPVLGTPASATLTNATGLPISTGVSGLGTGVATFLATPSSANLAAALTDETGSGANVFATSPTLVTPALGTPSSGVVTNLTGTASININGTVGATTATTGAFTTLTTSSTVTMPNNVAFRFTDSTSTVRNTFYLDASNNLQIQNNVNNGNIAQTLYGTGAYTWNNSTTEQMRLTSTGLGIGTSSPAAKLDVVGAIRLTGNISTKVGDANEGILNGTQLFPASAGLSSFGAVYGDSNASSGITLYGQNHATKPSVVEINTISGNKITYNTSGNLGLGVTPSAWGGSYKALQTPAGSLSAFSTSQFGVNQNAYDSGTGTFVYATTAAASRYLQLSGQHLWYNAASGTAGNAITFTQAMTLDASGNLGIGTSSPAAKLNIAGTGASSNTLLLDGTTTGANFARIKNTGADGVLGVEGSSGSVIVSGSSAYATVLYTIGATSLQFGTNSATKATIDSTGNMALGVVPSAWASPLRPLQIFNASLAGHSSDGTAMYLSANTYFDTSFKYISTAIASQYRQQAGVHSWYSAASGTAGNAITFTQAMTLDASGNLGIGTSSPTVKLDVVGQIIASSTITANGNLKVVDSANNYGTIQLGTAATYKFTGGATFSGFRFEVPSGTNQYDFQQGGTTRALINAYGIGLGATSPSSGTGITFPATQSASSNANTLDDYEEGTFTPTIVRESTALGTVTYTTQDGKYTKIGRVVYITCSVAWSNIASAGAGSNRIDGLPFSSGISQTNGGATFYSSDGIATNPVLAGLFYNSTIYLRKSANILAVTNISEAYNNSGSFAFNGYYFV